jgi:YfiH family protein
MEVREHESGVVTWHFSFDGPEVFAAVSTRTGGVSRSPYDSLNLGDHVGDDPAQVAENRRRLCEALGIDRFACADQQHGTRVAIVGPESEGAGYSGRREAEERLPATDALLTDRPGIALAVAVADCAPAVLYDPVRRAVGVVHAGRRGVVHDVIGAAVAAMSREFGSRPGDLCAGIGPCIGWASYEIGPAETSEVRDRFGECVLAPTQEGHARFDLPSAVRARLRGAGVRDECIESSGVDTAQRTDAFFSDRAERPCGRMMLVAGLG